MLKRLLGEGFRVFFLSAGVFAVLALGWWEIYLGVQYTGGVVTAVPFVMAPHEWHGHELVFGYGGAALGGFLLTAVPNWTGAPGARRLFVGFAAGIWFAGRLAVFWSGALPFWVVAGLDLAFVPILWIKIAALLIHRPKPPNVMFLLFLSLFWLSDLASWLGLAGIWEYGEITGPRAGLMALAGMILVIGGRVGPGFTRNAIHRTGAVETALPSDWPGFTPVMLAAAVLLPLATLFLPDTAAAASLSILAGVAQLVRQSRWVPRFALTQPILASLHGGLALTAIGLILLGLSQVTALSEVAGLHVLAIGGIGGMTLAMMSRATLGHSGRPLVAPRAVAVAYALLPVAALVRWLGSQAAGASYFPLVLASGALWIAAFGLYTGALLPAFLGPRIEKAPISPPPDGGRRVGRQGQQQPRA